jgi:bifunctional DNA-binding transcriptional regulator/antitoxin component of YhaV-PrlF toxin-antitoxin module
MKFTGSVTEERQLVLPKEVMESLRLEPGARVEVEIRAATDAKPYEFDEKRFDAAIERYRGPMRQQFLAEGWTSVDEHMDFIRPKC